MSDGSEPHDLFLSVCPYGRCSSGCAVGRGCTRGGADRVGREGAIPVPRPSLIPGPILSIFLRLSPTHGQMKVNSSTLMRFPRYGPEKGPELTRIDPKSTLPRLVLRWSRDGPQMTLRTLISGLSHMAVWNMTLFQVLLTIADIIRVSSKDWIAPPT